MAKTSTSPQVPGETPPAAESVGEETVTVNRSTLEAMQAQIDKLSAAVAAGPARPAIAKQSDLPDQSEIDQTTIPRPVLSKQGWVVPAKYGSNPNAPK